MTRAQYLFPASLCLAMLIAVQPAMARRDRDQDNLREAATQGQVIPLNKLVADIQSREPYRSMTYLGGPQFDASSMRYALKFLDGRRLVVVYVDARSGRIVGHQP